MKIAIIGGATSGWMTASWIKKIHPHVDITVVESPTVPRIGVGESVTVHLTEFMRVLGIDERHFMFETGSIYKYGNNFINWVDGKGEYELFTFSFNKNKQHLYSSPYKGVSWDRHLEVSEKETRLTDYWLDLHQHKMIDGKFTEGYTGWNYFTDDPKAPYIDGAPYLPENDLIYAYHINTEKFADYLKDHVALPSGVNHILGHVTQVIKKDHEHVEKVVLDTGVEVEADLYLDCSGFHRVLMREFDDIVKWKEYTHTPANRAMVCQVDYEDPHTEMVNYTKSIAMDKGWAFDIDLFYRRGTGYIYSNDYISDDEVYEEYTTNILKGKQRFEPKIIPWEKKRMLNPGFGNVGAIGMTIGFVEPMEANMLGVISNSAWTFTNILTETKDVKNYDWKTYNKVIGYTIDDIADFISVHYTLSKRTDNEFWKEMQSWGKQLHHEELLLDKYHDYKNTINGAAKGLCFFPDYMWIELAASWKMDLSKWTGANITEDERQLAKMHFDYVQNHMKLSSKKFPNYYEFLKAEVFKGYTPQQWIDEKY